VVVRAHEALSTDALAELAHALSSAADEPTRAGALAAVAEAARSGANADVAIVRVQTTADQLEAVAVSATPALAAELEGTRLPVADVPQHAIDDLSAAPPCARHAAERAAARSILLLPLHGATLELYRVADRFEEAERLVAEIAATHITLVLRAFTREGAAVDELAHPALELAGEALAVALDSTHTAEEVARVAASVVGAPVGLLWDPAGSLAGSYGLPPESDVRALGELVDASLAESGPVRPVKAPDLPGGCGISVSLALGQPAVGVLQLLFGPDDEPAPEQLARLQTFGVRAAHALRTSTQSQALALELQRTRALLAVVGQATAELSLAHTLDTAVDRVAELLGVTSIAIYLFSSDRRLSVAAERGVVGPHLRVAERLLEIALGPARARAVVHIEDATRDPRLQDARDAAREIERSVGRRAKGHV